MKLNDNRWNLATVTAQSVAVFCITFLVSAIPTLLHDTHVATMEGKCLPALTQWVQDVLPADFCGMVCLAILVSLTHACAGVMLVKTAASEVQATQRIAFLGSVTWGLVFLSILILAIALALPFLYCIAILPTDEELRAQAARNRRWVAFTAVYVVILIAATIRVCRGRTRDRDERG